MTAGSDFLVRAIAAARPLAACAERLRRMRALPSPKPGGYALVETIAAARPALLAALHRELGGTILAIVPTPDAAERAFADLLYYLGETEPERVALLRSRDEAIGAIESPSERSARMTLLADLSEGRPRIVLAPIGALRQYMMPRALFDELRFTVRPGDEPGWDDIQQRLHRLGYTRADVVSAAGEYAVRGGIVDVFAATAPSAVRVEFFGDAIEIDAFLRTRIAAQHGRNRFARDRAVVGDTARLRACASACCERFDGPQRRRRRPRGVHGERKRRPRELAAARLRRTHDAVRVSRTRRDRRPRRADDRSGGRDGAGRRTLARSARAARRRRFRTAASR